MDASVMTIGRSVGSLLHSDNTFASRQETNDQTSPTASLAADLGLRFHIRNVEESSTVGVSQKCTEIDYSMGVSCSTPDVSSVTDRSKWSSSSADVSSPCIIHQGEALKRQQRKPLMPIINTTVTSGRKLGFNIEKRDRLDQKSSAKRSVHKERSTGQKEHSSLRNTWHDFSFCYQLNKDYANTNSLTETKNSTQVFHYHQRNHSLPLFPVKPEKHIARPETSRSDDDFLLRNEDLDWSLKESFDANSLGEQLNSSPLQNRVASTKYEINKTDSPAQGCLGQRSNHPNAAERGLLDRSSSFSQSLEDLLSESPCRTNRPILGTKSEGNDNFYRSVSYCGQTQAVKEKDEDIHFQPSARPNDQHVNGRQFWRGKRNWRLTRFGRSQSLFTNIYRNNSSFESIKGEESNSSSSPSDMLKTSQNRYSPSIQQCTLAIPTFTVKEDSLKRIDASTLASMMYGKYDQIIRQLIIVDCRFEYEFSGGHIPGAINLNTLDSVIKNLLGSSVPSPSYSLEERQFSGHEARPVIVFHCEYSQHRAPKLAMYMRSQDRERNKNTYPRLCYPDLYILEGGYSTFFEKHKDLCAGGYVKMNDSNFRGQRGRSMHNFRRASKFSRTQSYTFGQTPQNMCSPTPNNEPEQQQCPSAKMKDPTPLTNKFRYKFSEMESICDESPIVMIKKISQNMQYRIAAKSQGKMTKEPKGTQSANSLNELSINANISDTEESVSALHYCTETSISIDQMDVSMKSDG